MDDVVQSLIAIPIEKFYEAKGHYNPSKYSHLKTAFEELRRTHPCLGSNSHHKFPPSKQNNNYSQGNHSRKTMDRPRIGTRELSREDMVRKDFLSNMNKLTKSNVENITRALRASFYLDYLHHYVSITWDMMHKQHDYQLLFVNILNNIRSLLMNPCDAQRFDDTLAQKGREYLDDGQWLPPVSILSESQDYDEFCDYMKWKKKSQGMLKAVIILMTHNLITPNFEEVIEKMSDSLQIHGQDGATDPRTLECILEALLICAKNISKNQRHISDDWIVFWTEHSEEWPKNAKFKMMDIKECLKN